MKGYLVDTNVALIGMSDPARLSPAIRQAMDTGPNFLSIVSYWEVMIKSMKGSLIVGDPRSWWTDAMGYLASTPQYLQSRHIAALHSLVPIHKDPFDRILIAQATTENLVLVTTDAAILRYASADLQVIA